MTDYKKDFPLLAESDIAYLDNAATCLLYTSDAADE